MIGQDVVTAVRLILKRPAFSGLVVLVLSLGIGAGSGVLTLADTIFWRPLPFRDPDQLVAIYRFHRENQRFGTVSYPDYVDYRQGDSALAGILAFCRVSVVVSSGPAARKVPAELVSGNYFSLLGIHAQLGRTILDRDDVQPGAQRVAVLSDPLWKSLYGADPQIVGRTITLDRRSYEVVGVAPPGFQGVRFDSPTGLWVPLAQQAHLLPGIDLLSARDIPWLLLVGRLKEGAGIEKAQASMDRLQRQHAEDVSEGWQLRVLPGRYARFWPTFREPLSRFLRLLLGIVGCVLLAGCAAAGNLVLNRALERRHEFAIRQVLGAGRARIAGQITVEILFLSLLGGVGGILAARLTLALLSAFPLPAPVQASIPLDFRSVGFTILATALTALAFGIVPLLKATGRDLAGRLKEDGRAGTSGNRLTLRRILAVSQVGLALVAVWACGLLSESLQRARAAELGFDPANVLMGSVEVATAGYTPEQGRRFFESLREELASDPSAASVGFAAQVPVSRVGRFEDAFAQETTRKSIHVQVNAISPSYLHTLAIPLLAGREFSSRDAKGAPPAVILDEVLAARCWPDENPLGKRLRLESEQDERQVVGVVRGVQQAPPGGESRPVAYIPFGQTYRPQWTYFIRTKGDPSQAIPILYGKVREFDRNVPVFDVRPLTSHIEESLSQWRMAATLATVAGLWTLLLAILGIYGVVSFSVQSRTREMGIRIALGSAPGQLARRMLAEGLLLAAGGILAGILAGMSTASLLSGLLYGVQPTHPPTLIAVAVLLLAVSFVASYIPARRITRLDPVTALKYE